ncbi:MAG: acyl carrier protein [Alphaproteobacteria bacterium]|nr:acyl carrier protein [Alphaproteobacteria bacterium]
MYKAENSWLEPTEISDDSNLGTDIGLDSLDVTEIAMEAENAFDIVIFEREYSSNMTFGELVDLVYKKAK